MISKKQVEGLEGWKMEHTQLNVLHFETMGFNLIILDDLNKLNDPFAVLSNCRVYRKQ